MPALFRKGIWHPFLFAVYPVLALLAHNVEEIRLAAGLRSLLLSLLLAVLLFLILKIIARDSYMAAVACTLLLALFFSYGHIYNALESLRPFGLNLGRHRLLLPLWGGLALTGMLWIFRKPRDFRSITPALNLVVALSLVFPLVQIGSFGVRSWQAEGEKTAALEASSELHPDPSQPLPDIYYIILDGYGRDDVLRRFYDHDNAPFLGQLTQLGFYVARCSQSNYAQTQLSLSTALNMNYLPALSDRFTPQVTSRAGLPDLTKHSAVRRLLTSLGYKTVAFETGFHYTEIDDADLYLHPVKITDLTDFEDLFIRTTLARVATEGIAFLNIAPDKTVLNRAHREQVLFTLNTLRTLPQTPGPKFVFAHIVSPHLPHVFGPHGEPVDEPVNYFSGYRDQVTFINSQILSVVGEILAKSSIPPVIIIQGDHGPAIETPTRRMPILNVYYLPGGGEQSLYESISPVNSFRVVFDRYFGAAFELLPDTSYYSTYQLPYTFATVPDNRPGCR